MKIFMVEIDRAHRVVSGTDVGMVIRSEEMNLCVFFGNFHMCLSFAIFCISHEYKEGYFREYFLG